MNSTKSTDGVGKKIVEALKQQSDIDIVPVKEEPSQPELTNINTLVTPKMEKTMEEYTETPKTAFEEANANLASMNLNTINNAFDTAFNNTMMNIGQSAKDINMAAVDEMELPANVAVLKQLITKIPAGVSKQTGALIIKQTMEALGISMTNVLQEAQQVQENLTQSVKECHNNVLEYKKQINQLEVQAQKYQRQFAAINDIISLFIQTN